MKVLVVIMSLFFSMAYAAEINVKVQGMVCSMCSQGIQKKFSAIKEVKSVQVDLTNKLVKLITNDGQNIEDAQIKKVITEAGYNVAAIERK